MPEPRDANDDRAALDLLVKGFQVSRLLRLVADLGIADRIAPDGHVAVDALAMECGVQPQPLIRVLRALAAFGVFSVATDGSIAHTPRSRLLRTDTPNSMHYSARFWTAPGSWAAWGMLDVAMTGGVPHDGRLEHEPVRLPARTFRRGPRLRRDDGELPRQPTRAVAAAYDFSSARLIADIGGGNGAMLRHILSRFARPRGLMFDSDHVVDAIQAGDLLSGRIEVARRQLLRPHSARR